MAPEPCEANPVPIELCQGCDQWAAAMLFHPSDVIGDFTRTFLHEANQKKWRLCPACRHLAVRLKTSLGRQIG